MNLKLFDIMAERKITQKQLSQATGISQGNISDWKNGRSSPKLDALLKISAYLNISVKDLADIDVQPAADGTGDGLSEAERSLIELYRLLTSEQKDMVDQVARTAAAAQRSSPKP